MIGKNCSISSGELGYEVFPFTVASMRMEQGCVGVTILKPNNARPTSGNGMRRSYGYNSNISIFSRL